MSNDGYILLARNQHKTEVGHICFGSKANNDIGGVFRGIVFLVNPVLDSSRVTTGGVPPFDYIISSNPCWLYGEHNGKTDLRGVNFRKIHDTWSIKHYAEAVQVARAEGRKDPTVIEANCLTAALKVITLHKYAYSPVTGGIKQQFSFLPDDVFEDSGLKVLKDYGIGLALAATRYAGCAFTVLSGLEEMRESQVYGAVRNWIERYSPDWLYSYKPSELLPVYKNPNKFKKPSYLGV